MERCERFIDDVRNNIDEVNESENKYKFTEFNQSYLNFLTSFKRDVELNDRPGIRMIKELSDLIDGKSLPFFEIDKLRYILTLVFGQNKERILNEIRSCIERQLTYKVMRNTCND